MTEPETVLQTITETQNRSRAMGCAPKNVRGLPETQNAALTVHDFASTNGPASL